MNPAERFFFDQRTQEILENMTIPFAVYQYIDKRVVTVALSRGFCDEFGFEKLDDAYSVMDNDMYRATHPDDKTRVADAAYRFAAFDVPYDIVYRTRTLKDPGYIILHAYGRSIYPEPDVRLCLTWYANEGIYSPDSGLYGSILNQTLNHFLTEESQYRGMYYDYMTGLPNMAYFSELVTASRKRMKENDTASAILFFDMTGLKQFNQMYGFDEGNRLIQAVAAVLAKHFSSENCARFAKDHFAAFAPEEGLTELLDTVIDECAAANDGKTLPLRIGVYPERIEDVEVVTACDRARLAADSMKNCRHSYYSFFDDEMLAEEKNRQAIIDNLDRAIEEGWIQVYYQPIVRSTNGKVCNVEALARWNDPVRGMLAPYEFIPVLEESGLIHKLDLCVVKQVLKRLKAVKDEIILPVSINFSRTDFDACDLVHEICTLVDEAGIDRNLINIEITESMVGSDFDYMKEQIERFRAQGFEVWMDDFGSGYSSMNVLQSIKFDLIKFDMGFMRRLNEGENGRILLTEMMRMATSLGVDTVCEGVETEEQVRFLQEIGCSKLQGYYFMKPAPPDQVIEKYTIEIPNGIEDPRQSFYYDSMGRVNLYDLSFLANMDDSVLKDTFDTLPMGVLEISNDENTVRYVRSNQAFRDFMKRNFLTDLTDPDTEYQLLRDGYGSSILRAIDQCRDGNNRVFFDEKKADGSVVHSFLRKIVQNPVNGREAYAFAVLSVKEPDESTTYADIAQALAADYYNIYLIDLDTNDYIEYSSQIGSDKMTLERHGGDFFESARRDTMTRIYEEDREPFLELFTKEKVLTEIDRRGVFTTTYRLIDTGTPMYVNMKITRMRGGNRLILGVSIIDAHMKQLQETQKIKKLNQTITSLLDNMPGMTFTMDAETGVYLACNQAFADYAHKATPDSVVGLTDAEIFDAETVAHFAEDNQLALSMDKPYIFFEDVRDAAGERRQLQTTKFKYTDADGRLCIQGMCQDVTDMIRIQRENATTKEAYLQASSTATIYNHIAHALARDCTNLFYVNIDTNELIEFHTDDESGVLSEARRGRDFFEGCERDARLYLHPDDQEKFIKSMKKEFLTEALVGDKVFVLTYRQIKDGRYSYVQMKATRMEDDQRIIVIAVSDVDELMHKRKDEERIQEERQIYARLHAITGNFIVTYVVDPETDCYREFSSTNDYEKYFDREKKGEDFFNKVRKDALVFTHPQDLDRFLSVFSKENVLTEIDRSGIFSFGYRVLMDGRPLHIQMKAAMVEEKEGTRLILGLNDIDAQVRQEDEYRKRLAQAQSEANIDALTGVKNKHAFLVTEANMDQRIAGNIQPPFAVVVFDVNDLKKVNDTFGHQAGDQYLRDACRIICDIFKHSPVFRIGGDEFSVIAQGQDYECIENHIGSIQRHNEEASRTGGIVIACGMSKFENDDCLTAVFERADQKMYENKKEFK